MFMIVGSVFIVAMGKSMTHNDPVKRNYDDDLYLTSVDNEDDFKLTVDKSESQSFW